MRIKAILTVVRDALCLVWGFGGIAYQQYTQDVNLALLSVYVVMLGLPGGLALGHLLRGRPEIEPIPGSSPSSQSSVSQPRSP